MKNDKKMLSLCEMSGGVPVDHHEHSPAIEYYLDLMPVAAVVWALLCARALATTYESYPYHLTHGIYASSDLALQRACPYRNLPFEQVQSDDRRGRRIRSDESLSIQSLPFDHTRCQTPAAPTGNRSPSNQPLGWQGIHAIGHVYSPRNGSQ
jgi:hypothetical protein